MLPAGPALPFCPTPLVRLLWGSRSTRRTRRSATASDAARLIAVVVFPTPPFWLATATILAITAYESTSVRSSTSLFWQLTDKAESILSSARRAHRGYGEPLRPSTALFHVEHMSENRQER